MNPEEYEAATLKRKEITRAYNIIRKFRVSYKQRYGEPFEMSWRGLYGKNCELLGVKPDVTLADVRVAYSKYCQKFKIVQAAYGFFKSLMDLLAVKSDATWEDIEKFYCRYEREFKVIQSSYSLFKSLMDLLAVKSDATWEDIEKAYSKYEQEFNGIQSAYDFFDSLMGYGYRNPFEDIRWEWQL